MRWLKASIGGACRTATAAVSGGMVASTCIHHTSAPLLLACPLQVGQKTPAQQALDSPSPKRAQPPPPSAAATETIPACVAAVPVAASSTGTAQAVAAASVAEDTLSGCVATPRAAAGGAEDAGAEDVWPQQVGFEICVPLTCLSCFCLVGVGPTHCLYSCTCTHFLAPRPLFPPAD